MYCMQDAHLGFWIVLKVNYETVRLSTLEGSLATAETIPCEKQTRYAIPMLLMAYPSMKAGKGKAAACYGSIRLNSILTDLAIFLSFLILSD